MYAFVEITKVLKDLEYCKNSLVLQRHLLFTNNFLCIDYVEKIEKELDKLVIPFTHDVIMDIYTAQCSHNGSSTPRYLKPIKYYPMCIKKNSAHNFVYYYDRHIFSLHYDFDIDDLEEGESGFTQQSDSCQPYGAKGYHNANHACNGYCCVGSGMINMINEAIDRISITVSNTKRQIFKIKKIIMDLESTPILLPPLTLLTLTSFLLALRKIKSLNRNETSIIKRTNHKKNLYKILLSMRKLLTKIA